MLRRRNKAKERAPGKAKEPEQAAAQPGPLPLPAPAEPPPEHLPVQVAVAEQAPAAPPALPPEVAVETFEELKTLRLSQQERRMSAAKELEELREQAHRHPCVWPFTTLPSAPRVPHADPGGGAPLC